MPIDWSILLLGPTAVVGAYAGARIRTHLDRARPIVSVSGCRLASGRDLLTTRIDVPLDLTRKLRENPWVPTFADSVNAARIADAVDTMRRTLASSPTVLKFLEEKLRELQSLEGADVERKRKFIDEITSDEVDIIHAVMVGSLVRKELVLRLPEDDKLGEMPDVAEYVERDDERGGYRINLGYRWHHFEYRDKDDNPYLLPGVKALCKFHIPSLRQILEHVKTRAQHWATSGAETIDEVDSLLRQNSHLVVELVVANRGRSAVLFTPWAALRLFGSTVDHLPEIHLRRASPLWKPEDPVEAEKQTRILKQIDDPIEEVVAGFVVSGGSTMRLAYKSLLRLDELKKAIPKIEEILSMDFFSCQVCLKRADFANGKKAWVFSSTGRFGGSGEPYPTTDMRKLEQCWAT